MLSDIKDLKKGPGVIYPNPFLPAADLFLSAASSFVAWESKASSSGEMLDNPSCERMQAMAYIDAPSAGGRTACEFLTCKTSIFSKQGIY